jgi:hypothetical protein
MEEQPIPAPRCKLWRRPPRAGAARRAGEEIDALVRGVGLRNHAAQNTLYLGGNGLLVGRGNGGAGARCAQRDRCVQRRHDRADGRVRCLHLRGHRADIFCVLVYVCRRCERDRTILAAAAGSSEGWLTRKPVVTCCSAVERACWLCCMVVLHIGNHVRNSHRNLLCAVRPARPFLPYYSAAAVPMLRVTANIA